MDWLTADLDNVQGYIHDLMVFSATLDEEDKLTAANFFKYFMTLVSKSIRKRPCWLVQKSNYVAVLLTSDDGIHTPPENLEVIKNYPQPTTVKCLKSFLGGVNFYRFTIPNFATIAPPLHKLLQGKKTRFASLVF